MAGCGASLIDIEDNYNLKSSPILTQLYHIGQFKGDASVRGKVLGSVKIMLISVCDDIMINTSIISLGHMKNCKDGSAAMKKMRPIFKLNNKSAKVALHSSIMEMQVLVTRVPLY